MTPAKVLIGSVRRERLDREPGAGGEILFRKPRGIFPPEGRSEAVLVVLEPDQSPKEVAETILWALR